MVFGGSGDAAYGDLWELRSGISRRGNVTWTWSRLEATSDPDHGVPAPRYGTGMVEIEAGAEQGKMLIYGGYETRPWHVFRDTWLYDPETNSYTRLDVPSPTAAFGFAMAWSPSLHAVVINGGQPDSGVLTDETWAFDPSNLVWMPVQTNADVPEARSFHKLVSNTCDGSAMLFGPAQGATSNGTWVLR